MENIECPEPKVPPMTQGHVSYEASQQTSSRVYNKQIINNQMQQQFPYFSSACPPVLTFAPVPMGLNVRGPTINPNTWTVHPMFMTPSLPVVQQAHTSVSDTYKEQEYDVSKQNTSVSHSNTFPSHSESYETWNKFTPDRRQKSPLKRDNFQKIYKHSFERRNCTQKLSSNDLRNILSARKSQNNFKGGSTKPEGKSDFIL